MNQPDVVMIATPAVNRLIAVVGEARMRKELEVIECQKDLHELDDVIQSVKVSVQTLNPQEPRGGQPAPADQPVDNPPVPEDPPVAEPPAPTVPPQKRTGKRSKPPSEG